MHLIVFFLAKKIVDFIYENSRCTGMRKDEHFWEIIEYSGSTINVSPLTWFVGPIINLISKTHRP